MPPVIIKLNNHYKGDSWPGMQIGPVLIDGLTPVNPLASVRMQFREADTEDFGYELNTTPAEGQGLIVITNAAAWEITIPPLVLDLEAGRWVWDFECTDTAGFVITLYRGTLVVKGDITYDN